MLTEEHKLIEDIAENFWIYSGSPVGEQFSLLSPDVAEHYRRHARAALVVIRRHADIVFKGTANEP